MNKVIKHIQHLADNNNLTFRIVQPHYVLIEAATKGIHIVPPTELHFTKFKDRNMICHKDNNFSFDDIVFDKMTVEQIKKRLDLFLNQSIGMKMSEMYKCIVCFMSKQRHVLDVMPAFVANVSFH